MDEMIFAICMQLKPTAILACKQYVHVFQGKNSNLQH